MLKIGFALNSLSCHIFFLGDTLNFARNFHFDFSKVPTRFIFLSDADVENQKVLLAQMSMTDEKKHIIVKSIQPFAILSESKRQNLLRKLKKYIMHIIYL